MLVLARKVGQSVVVGESIEVTVIEIRGEQVRLGIVAPRSVTVKRKELLMRENEDKDASTEDSETSSSTPEI